MIYVGIDPGLRSGAVGAIDHNGQYIGCFDIQSDEKRIDARLFKEALHGIIQNHDVEICIELVNPMPGQGSVSTGGFMRAAGAIEAVAMLIRCPVTFVPPRVWKKAMSLSSDKSASLDLARQLYPMAPLIRKKDNNRAEALLLAEYLRRENV